MESESRAQGKQRRAFTAMGRNLSFIANGVGSHKKGATRSGLSLTNSVWLLRAEWFAGRMGDLQEFTEGMAAWLRASGENRKASAPPELAGGYGDERGGEGTL